MKINTANVALVMTAGDSSQFPREPLPQIALSGRSNVGKSSLINALLGRKSLARVSSSPGKTVTVNFYRVDGKLFLVDLPGYGYAKRSPAELRALGKLTDGFFTGNRDADRLRAVIQLIDIRVGITADDATMLDYMTQTGIPFIIVMTKADKPNKTEREAAVRKIKSDAAAGAAEAFIPFSSVTGEGKAELWSAITGKIEK